VESVQTESGPRQRPIMHLGTLSLPKEEWSQLARVLEARLAGQPSLFEGDKKIVQTADQVMGKYRFTQLEQADMAIREEKREKVTVDMQSINMTESRSLGPELVAHATWNKLDFDEVFGRLGVGFVSMCFGSSSGDRTISTA
jgi:hypothetical protein